MMRIPKSVKSMKVSEFNAIYKIDLVKLVQGKKAMLAAGGKSLTTPLKPTNQANLTTPSRNLRRGEQLLYVFQHRRVCFVFVKIYDGLALSLSRIIAPKTVRPSKRPKRAPSWQR